MKVRIGLSAGGESTDPAGLAALADGIQAVGFDSLWLPELLSGPTVDPVVGLAWAAGRNPKLKIGTTMLVPGRNLLRLAKQVASLDALSSGRFLVTMVPGLARGPERMAIGVPPPARGSVIDEAMPLLRRLWSGESVTYSGSLGEWEGVTLAPLPVQDPFDVWSGGLVPSSLERCGRLFDGWLPAFCTPEEVAQGRRRVEEAAAQVGRSISPEHFGVSLAYSHQELDERVLTALRPRARNHSVAEIVPVGLPALRQRLEQFLEVGFSKFVVRPLRPPDDWPAELEILAAAVGDLQT